MMKSLTKKNSRVKSWWWRHRFSLSIKGETLACRYLQENGYRILKRRYRTKYGEIDIVARNSSSLAFVEVKTRRGFGPGDPLESITWGKWRRLQRAGMVYLYKHPKTTQGQHLEFLGIGVGISKGQIRLRCVPLFPD